MVRAIVEDGHDLTGPTHDEEQMSVTDLLNRLAHSQAVLRPAGSLGTRQDIESEIDSIAAAVRTFDVKQPDQVMRECAAYSARLTELTVLLHRVESKDRQYTRVRTQQVEKFLAELDRQFKIASRLVEVARQDLDLLRGSGA